MTRLGPAVRTFTKGMTFAALLGGVATIVWSLAPAALHSGQQRVARFRPIADFDGLRLSIDGAPTRGNPNARIVVIEYSDYECPYCGTFAREVQPHVAKRYVSTGRVQWVFRNYPITAIHPFAAIAAQGAECAGEQNKFWSMHDALFADQSDLSKAAIMRRAGALALNLPAFQECLDGPESERVVEEVSDARSMGIRGTPTLLVTLLEGTGRVRVVRGLSGVGTPEELEAILEALLISVQTRVP